MHLPIYLSGLVVYAWLVWLFDGSIRQWITAVAFPSRWRAGTPRGTIAHWSAASYEQWLSLEATCPVWLRKLLFCPFCCAFHVSWIWCLFFYDLDGMFPVAVFASAGIAMFLLKLRK